MCCEVLELSEKFLRANIANLDDVIRDYIDKYEDVYQIHTSFYYVNSVTLDDARKLITRTCMIAEELAKCYQHKIDVVFNHMGLAEGLIDNVKLDRVFECISHICKNVNVKYKQ